MTKKIALIIPCYNESTRLSIDSFKELNQYPSIDLYLVNDGSSDSTLKHLMDLKSKNIITEAVDLQPNRGKAEAVRFGLNKAIHDQYEYIGFADADFATPPSEINRITELLFNSKRPLVMGSRIKRMGATIDRNGFRHYFGRIFATCASIILQLPIYDTQCGAKFFHVTPELKLALKNRFVSRWFFDIELIGRLNHLRSQFHKDKTIHNYFWEEPLLVWKDIGGSKLKLSDFFKVPIELLKIDRSLKTWKKTNHKMPTKNSYP